MLGQGQGAVIGLVAGETGAIIQVLIEDDYHESEEEWREEYNQFIRLLLSYPGYEVELTARFELGLGDDHLYEVGCDLTSLGQRVPGLPVPGTYLSDLSFSPFLEGSLYILDVDTHSAEACMSVIAGASR
jgi:hypothetical protein